MPPAPITARPMRSEGAMRVAGGRWRDNVRRMGCAAIVDSWPVDPCPVDRLGADVSGAASLPESSVGNPAASAEPAATDLTKFRRLLAAGDLESDFPVSLMMHMRWRSVEGRVSRTGWPDNVSVGRSGQQKEERMRTTATLRKSRRRIIDAAARWARTAFVPLLLFGTVGCGANPSPADDLVRVVVETDMGAFELEVDIDPRAGHCGQLPALCRRRTLRRRRIPQDGARGQPAERFHPDRGHPGGPESGRSSGGLSPDRTGAHQ